MTVIEVGERRVYLLFLPTVFLLTFLSVSVLFSSVFGLGPIGALLGFISAVLLTLLAFFILRQGWS